MNGRVDFFFVFFIFTEGEHLMPICVYMDKHTHRRAKKGNDYDPTTEPIQGSKVEGIKKELASIDRTFVIIDAVTGRNAP